MKVTVKDVAAEAECSSSLVSFYLNHPGTTRVAAGTRERIDRAVAKLNYRPNLLASILKSGRDRVVGVLIDSEAPDSTRRLLTKLEREACRRNLYLQVSIFHNNLESLFAGYTILKQYGACGILCLCHDYPEFNRELDRRFSGAGDLVFYNGPERPEHPCLIPDVGEGIRMAFGHLRSTGRTRISLCIQEKGLDFSAVLSRVEGYRTLSCREALPLCMLPCGLSVRDAMASGMLPFVKEHRPDALLFQSDRFALCAMQLLLSRGIRVPDEIAVFGFDDDPQGAEATPSLSTVARDDERMAKQLLDLLFARLSTERTVRTVYSALRLVLRESC